MWGKEKGVSWKPRTSALGETFASNVRPWNASSVEWRILTLIHQETKDNRGGAEGWLNPLQIGSAARARR